MQLSVNDFGMDIRAILDCENNPEAAALYSAVARGDISGMSFLFSVDSERWDNLESDYPTRHIISIGSVVEVSAVTFPAYQATEIYARSNEALESARQTLESAREQRAQATKPATEKAPAAQNELELAKAKLNLLTGGYNNV